MERKTIGFDKIRLNKVEKADAIEKQRISKKDIAIIGISAKFSLADNYQEFWENLKNGVDAIREYPEKRRKDADDYLQYMFPGKKVAYKDASYIEEIDNFDYSFFRISPKEASLMDPHQRLFLQAVWDAIEDAGYGGGKLVGTRTGVYVGYKSQSSNLYQRFISDIEPSSLDLSVVGNKPTMMAGRISYLLNLRGPSLLVDTACSASLVAVHLACQGIRSGDCDSAIVGGVKINFIPVSKDTELGIGEDIGIESCDGRTRTFDDMADGTGLGEGVAAIMLKPLSKALEDGDSIHAVIKGISLNQDGTSIGITAPNAMAHEDLILNAWKDAGVEADTIDYIEAHGTATRLGDPIEIDGIERAFRKCTDKKQFCAVGAVKSNLGHTDNVAGLAGLIKAVLALKYKEIPPTVNFYKPSNVIDFVQSPIYVNYSLKPWEKKNRPRRCGVSSFGISGTNCHIVLEEAPEHITRIETGRGKYDIFTLSAKSEDSLKELIKSYRNYINNAHEFHINDLCYTANTGRGHYDYRLAMVVESKEDLAAKIRSLDYFNLESANQIEGIYYETTKAENDDVKQYDNDVREKRALTDNIIRGFISAGRSNAERLGELCRLYTSGAQIDWNALYKGEQVRTIGLPTYPFEKKRCWLEVPKTPREGVYTNRAEGSYPIANAENRVELSGKESGDYSKSERLVAGAWNEILGYEKMSIHSNFYDLGGDSVTALKIVNLLNRKAALNLHVVEQLKNPTILGLANVIDQTGMSGKIHESTGITIEPVEKSDYYMLSSAQKRIYIINELDGVETSYNLPMVMLIEGRLDRARVKEAFKALVKRHEALRTSFRLMDGEPVQIIHDEIEFDLFYTEAAMEQVDGIVNTFIKPFTLNQSPLFRAGLVKVSEERSVLLFDIHHIIADGTSVNILVREFIDLYHNGELKELKVQYKDYSLWQLQHLKEGGIKKQEEFWLKLFEGEIPVLNMPYDYPRPALQSFEGESLSFTADNDLVNRLRMLAAKTNSTLFMILLAAYNVLLHKYSAQEDIIVGSPIMGRPHADLQDMVGVFINTLPFRNYPETSKEFEKFLGEVKDNALMAYEHQSYPFEELVEKLSIKRDLSRNPLLDVMFVMQNTENKGMVIEGLKFTPYRFNNKTSKFDIYLSASEMESVVEFELQYASRLFKRETAQRMSEHFINILNQIVENPSIKIGEIDMLTQAEKDLILNRFNNTAAEYEKDKTIHELFERQAENTPNRVAIVVKDIEVTYGELNMEANRLARHLRKKGIKNGMIVGLMVERSIEMIVGILGILKAGGAYLPIDPEYPLDRVNYMLEDSGAVLLLTQEHLKDSIRFEGEILCLTRGTSFDEKSENLPSINHPKDLIYVIYTSGSTGKPKGVMLEHRGVNNFIQGMTDKIDFTGNKTILGLTTISFDIFVLEVLLPLTKGVKIVLADENEQRNPADLIRLITKQGVNMLQLTPSRLQMLISDAHNLDFMKQIKTIMVGGEALPEALFRRLKAVYPNKIYNMYGPTETTVWSAVKDLTETDNITIGEPILNTTIYILSSSGKLQPIGVAGELCIGGDGVARGYLNRPDLTGEKFVPDPYAQGERIYKTGDLARWLPDGEIEFMGRIDYQVKLRGYRIELGEIEGKISAHPAVKDAVVMVKSDAAGDKYLCAYYLSETTVDMQGLRSYLSKELPEYMVPSYFVKLDQFPMTPNGKIDRKALPDPEINTGAGVEYVAPRNIQERRIAEAWQQVLKVKKVGINHNFFHIGGDSIKAIRLVSILSKDFNITVKDVFSHQTVTELASNIRYNEGNLKNKLDYLKKLADEGTAALAALEEEAKKKDGEYSSQYNAYDSADLKKVKSYRNVLLAGSTGYLGIYILHQLLVSGDSDIYVLVRGKSREESVQRLKDKLEYYFQKGFYEEYKGRIKVLSGDLSRDLFGLEHEEYVELADNIECIINSAANVSHYGHYDDFFEINVKGVERLIDFCSTGREKDLNQISTLSVVQGAPDEKSRSMFTEYDYGISDKIGNYYVKTKNIAELKIIEARQKGIKANIFRVGNLVFDSNTGKFQQNIWDNAFYSIIRSYIHIGAAPEVGLKYDFSYIDYVADAVVKLYNRENLINETYHLFNDNEPSLTEFIEFLNAEGYGVKSCSLDKFIGCLYDIYDDKNMVDEVNTILLHYGLFDNSGGGEAYNVGNKKTNFILERLGFVWPQLNRNHVTKMLEHCIKVNFLPEEVAK
ncbi:MAG: amino acid adenylation domain-containing protein [Clostridia bacterium]|nr:amino acid adenylation domain-containing protein [Clostridia bacterium]